jgi:Ca2+-binding EF-hand superfamily protein
MSSLCIFFGVSDLDFQSHQIAQLRVLFEYIDVDGDGIISFFEFIQLLGMTDAT